MLVAVQGGQIGIRGMEGGRLGRRDATAVRER